MRISDWSSDVCSSDLMNPNPRALFSPPARSLVWIGGFLVAVALLVILVAPRLIEMFRVNPFFNGVILAVLAAGILVNVRQVLAIGRAACRGSVCEYV